ncbi:hypothetical protein COV93_07340 [Candidatus Woesearchaeota archaeon CG11_big_fil_rev_8_21_14_0_20_43_8]|nr:MAG: hypothetical protein COV93_07340 [Candidatus Woesearchaeota archaeon CG11_big_fil_rev_8_21_14_0_20_43_8]PIO08833.1 MAG: hypothetical protein COT47_01005 [Candidatus Woesearchaeota archaeon CG08_land_8_20_14_0_20_43_7]
MDRRLFLAGLGSIALGGAIRYSTLGCTQSGNSETIKQPEPTLTIGPEIKVITPPEKQIYLTIDDGPTSYTEQILDTLHPDDRVTFFMIGERLDKQNGYDIACEVLKKGHDIGNHSYTHPFFSKQTIDDLIREISHTDKAIDAAYKTVSRENPRLFRFPYNDFGGKNMRATKRYLKENGYIIVRWDRDLRDWEYHSGRASVDQIIANVTKAKQYDIVLCHETRATIELVIPTLRSKNIRSSHLAKDSKVKTRL